MDKKKKIAYGYVMQVLDESVQIAYHVNKAVFSNNQTLSTSTKGRSYRADNDFLIRIRKTAIENVVKHGLNIKGTIYRLSKQAIEKLYTEKCAHIMPDDIYDAIFCGKPYTENDNRIFQNLYTQTCVICDRGDLIIDIFVLSVVSAQKKFFVSKGSGSSGRGRRSLPRKGNPGSRERLYDKDGKPKQERKYDDKGNPEQDNDYTDHGDSKHHDNPHSHFWDGDERGPAVPFVPFE